MTHASSMEKAQGKTQGALGPDTTSTTASQDDQTNEIFLSEDGFKLFPQPVSGDALDPLNWPFIQKHAILAIVMSL
jgi:hypothetical protein